MVFAHQRKNQREKKGKNPEALPLIFTR